MLQLAGRLLKYSYHVARVSNWIEQRLRAAITRNMVFPGQPVAGCPRWLFGPELRVPSVVPFPAVSVHGGWRAARLGPSSSACSHAWIVPGVHPCCPL